MLGIISAVVAGSVMSIQGVMNTRLSDKIGLYETNMIVQGTAFALSVIAALLMGKNGLGGIREINRWYLLGGVLGLVITISVMLSMKGLSPTAAVSIILIAQLLTAAVIDYFGLMESERMPFLWNKFVGLALMIGGVILFKIK